MNILKHHSGISIFAASIITFMSSGAMGLELKHANKEEIEKKTEATIKEGWDGALRIGSGISLSSNQNVVGQTDGTLFTLGLSLDGALDYRRTNSEWRNSLAISEMVSRTPDIGQFSKTADAFDIESIYLYHLTSVPWLGPFGRFTLKTSLFEGRDVRGKTNEYVAAMRDGTTTYYEGDSKRLTRPFQPFKLKESLGMFAKPLDKKTHKLEFRLGLGSQQVIADGQFALDDDKDTPQIEIKELTNYSLLGSEAAVVLSGLLSEEKVSYKLMAEFLTPFVNSESDDERNAAELTSIEFGAKLSFKLVSWASLEYEFKAVKEPLLLDKFQVQNNLLLSFNYAFIERQTPPEKK